jgi:hypothetical protein
MKFYTQNKICDNLGIHYDNKLWKQNPIISSEYRSIAIDTESNITHSQIQLHILCHKDNCTTHENVFIFLTFTSICGTN